MRYLAIETPRSGAGHWPWWARILRRLLPSGNADLDVLQGQVTLWWLEVDEAGRPQREIGFDRSGAPIVLGPIGDNVGLLIDASDDWRDHKADSADAAAGFETAWERILPRFEHLETE